MYVVGSLGKRDEGGNPGKWKGESGLHRQEHIHMQYRVAEITLCNFAVGVGFEERLSSHERRPRRLPLKSQGRID